MISTAFAQTAGAPGGSDMLMQLVPFLLIFVIMYFLIIRPQQKRAKEHQNLIENVRRGDTVEAMTIERAQELLAGRRAWELENGGAPKKKTSKRKKSPTLTEKTISDAGSKKKSKKSATGKAKKSE